MTSSSPSTATTRNLTTCRPSRQYNATLMKNRLILTILAIISLQPCAFAQNLVREFRDEADSLKAYLKEKTTVDTELKIESITKRDNDLEFHFSQDLSDYHWTQRDIDLFRREIKKRLPEKYADCSVGGLYAKKTRLEELITPALGNSGNPSQYKYRYQDPRGKVKPLVTRQGEKYYSKGLGGRHIALWQSHGRYYEASTDRWEWQRAPLHTTVEDMYTQSYVLPFLIPMLENSGAYILTPRERDIQRYEVIIDNDPSFAGVREGLLRRKGEYSERGKWSDAGKGFADRKKVYYDNDNPFKMGTVRKAECATEEKGQKAEATWSFSVPEDGSYAVYVSYASLPNSCESAHYSVRHRSGLTEFNVNQKMGGGTWIYLGTFEFDSDEDNSVILDNIVDGSATGTVITADAVKIGGGMGKIARGLPDTPESEWTTSGLPSYAEGALYWEQWAGVDSTVTRNWEGDYTQDFASRGAWVSMMCGGSSVNPKYEGGKKIPVDLSLGFHSDAGITPNDSIIGTLSIYTLLADNKSTLPDGRSRQTGRHLAGMVQDQVCNDIRSDFEPLWSRRMLWNKNYSESRTTSVPGMLLELLSHNNMADMKYGLDPSFRFTVSRAVYKGILKFLSDEYGIPYVVQPLPVHAMEARLTDKHQVTLSWKATKDEKEPTADADDFILYTRVGDGPFDQGVRIPDLIKMDDRYSIVIGIDPDEIYSFKVVAENKGGKSFPSETVSVCSTIDSKGKVLVVNNFDRVSPPAWFESPQYAGFDRRLDSGVGYGYEINTIGDVYEYDRSIEWTDDDNPGFGGTHSNLAGSIIPGNTFDFIQIHGRSLVKAGYSFESASREAFTEGETSGATIVDLLCGKQVTVKIGSGAVPNRYEVFPAPLRNALKTHTENGGSIIISGAYIGTDVWSSIYPTAADPEERAAAQSFVKETLGYMWLTDHGCYNGTIGASHNKVLNLKTAIKEPFEFHQTTNSTIYSVENPDGIQPADKFGTTFLKYADNEVPAAVAFTGKGYKVVSFGFPLETVKDERVMDTLFAESLKFIAK